MEIKEINDEHEWERFVGIQEHSSILQSWRWGEVDALEKRPSINLLVIDRGEVVASSRINNIRLPFNFHYLYSPRGPVFKSTLDQNRKYQALSFLCQSLKAKYPGAIFFRVDPALTDKEISFYGEGFRKANKEIQPRHTIILDVRESEEGIIGKMKPKARYNLRIAEKKGVKVLTARNENDVSKFFDLLKNTESRAGFRLHPKEHYLSLWRALTPDHLKIYLAEINGSIIAAIMVSFYGNGAVYLHGGLSYEHRAYMAPYLLHWEAIKDAKKNGFSFYDLWGVAPQNAPADHTWSGITRFKEGFGGEFLEYVGAYDYVYRPAWYKAFNMARNIMRKL